jgi:hypothetical protein
MSVKNQAEKTPFCEICKTKDEVTLAPDPYRAAINGDKTPRNLCQSCRLDRSEAI